MATSTRIYVVTDTTTDAERTHRLVRATHPSTALTHVARSSFHVAVATQDDLERLLGDGVKVEHIRAEQSELPAT